MAYETRAHAVNRRLFSTSCLQGDIATPEFHAFTGTSFVNPRVMYDSLWRGIMGGKSPPSNIEKTLNDRLKWATPTSPMVVVILDEIDHLMSNSPRVLRKLFEWAYAPKSRLVSFCNQTSNITLQVAPFPSWKMKPDLYFLPLV